MPVEAPNTLRSRARYKIIDIISQGPCKGLVNGAKSVYLDETPIQARDNTLNFKNFQIATDLQELPIPDITGQIAKYNPALFPLSENEVSVGVQVTKDSPAGSGSGDGSVTRTISDTDVDSVRVTLRVPALTTTNTTTGDISGGKIRFKIEVKPDSSSIFTPISSASKWDLLTSPADEADDGATGLQVTATISGSKLIAKNGSWQYRRKVSGVWGDWVTFSTVNIPATSSASDYVGFYGFGWNDTQTFTKSINGLEPGIYQAQVVSTNATATITETYQFIEDALEIEGKTVSPYDADYIVQLPGTGPWDIKVSRISADPPSAAIQADLYWLSYTEQISNRFSWPYVAGAAITFDAEDFGGNIPTRSYDFMGLIVQIPINYDPYNRTYSGIWNGTFKNEWTDNPAWIFYDLLTNKRYGLGDNIDAAQIDKYALYQIAQYCDELVDAPNGEQEPRYTCSCVINSQSEAYELLTAIASAFRGMIYLSGGTITPTADMPSDPILNVGPANVIDGLFTYQGASRKSRHTVARVSWNNPDDGYKLNVELYEDDEAIRKYGYRPIDVNAFGCTSRGLARRWGKWAVVSDNDAPDTVTYKAGFDHFKLRPGDVVNIADPNYSGEQLFGLIMSVTDNVSPATHTIKLDRAVTRLAGDTSELQVTLADGTILLLDVAVLSNTTSDEITVDSVDLTTIPLAGASWLLKKGTVEPRQWRVISVSEDEPNIYQVTAMLYDPNKFDKIESDLNFAEADFTAFPDGPLPAPTSLITSEFLKQTGSAILACVNLSWTRPNDPRADLFEVQYKFDADANWIATEPNLTQFTGIDIINIIPGTYDFRVRAQDSSGLFRSEWTTLASETISGKNKAPEDVTGFTAEIEKYGVLMSWNPVSDIDIDYYEIRRGASWAVGTLVAKVKGTAYKWEDATEATYTFWIKALDTNGNESVNADEASAVLEVEAVPTVTATGVKGGATIEIAGVTTSRFAHYEVQRKQDGAADGTAVTLNALLASRTWTDTTIPVYYPPYVYRARAFNKNLNASAYGAWSNAVSPTQIANADISADAIREAIGSVGSWSAKNCTTASIAEVGGVRDVSGNANHGQAFGGVAVVDTEMGKALQFDGINDKIQISDSAFPSSDSARSFSAWVFLNSTSTGERQRILGYGSNGASTGVFDVEANCYESGTSSKFGIHWWGNGHTFSGNSDVIYDEWVHLAVTHSGGNLGAATKLYINGEYVGDLSAIDQTINTVLFLCEIGGRTSSNDLFLDGQIFDPRIYSRALSATEVKSLYMFPGDVAFGRITADLVTTGELITLSAQIADAIIGNAKISDLSAAKINAGTLDAARIAAGSISTDKLKVGKTGAALNDDPNFEDAASWTYSIGSIEIISDGKVGNKTYRSRTSTGAAGSGTGVISTGKFIPIDSSKTYRRKMKAIARNGTGGASYIYDYYYDASFNFLGNISYNIGALSSGSWVDAEYVFQYPAGAAYSKPRADINNGTPASGVYVEIQDLRLEEVLPETLIKDGAITTNKLTADQIIGKDFRTAANVGSGTSGVKFTSAGIEAWNGTTRTVNITSAGAASFSGTVTASAGAIGGITIFTEGLFGSGTELISSKYSAIGVFSKSYNSVVNLFDVSSACFRALSYTSGPNIFNESRVAASGYYDGSTTALAQFYAYCGSTSYYGFYTNGNIYVGNNCSALSFTDRTEMPESIEEAQEIVNSMFAKDGGVNYSRLSSKAKHFTIQKDKDGNEILEEGRDLTKTVSALVMVCQKLQEDFIRLKNRVVELENDEEIEFLKRTSK